MIEPTFILSDRKARFTRVLFYTSIFMMLAHAFIYFNTSFSHDSTNVCSFSDNRWQISLGRFLQPFYRLFRGKINAPFLIGILSTLWLAVSAMLIVDLLKIKRKLTVILVCGLLSTSSTLTLANATYIPWSDIFMLSLLLSVAGAYSVVKIKYGFIYAPLLISASLALYQAYFQVAVVLLMFDIFFYILDKQPLKAIAIKAFKYIAVLFLSLILYYVAYKFVLYITDIAAAKSYNSLYDLGDYSEHSIVGLFLNTYRNFAKYFLHPTTYSATISKTVNIIILILTIACIIRLIKTRSLSALNILMLALVIFLLPFGADLVFFIAKFEHSLMTLSFVLFYVLALKIAESYLEEFKDLPPKGGCAYFKQFTVWLFGAIIIFNNIVFANQVYLSKELQYQATSMIMSRVIHQIEELDSYVIGETPVAIIGDLNFAPLAIDRPGFEHLGGTGTEHKFSLTYYKTYLQYFEQILAYPINLLPESIATELRNTDEVQQMPCYPNKGFCQFIDGTLVIKFSD